MVDSEGRRIRECVDAGRYEEALSVSFDSSRTEINRAHIRLLSRYRGYPSIRELLNQAKSRIATETTFQKGCRLNRLGRKEEALRYLTKPFTRNNNPDDLLMVGQILAQTWRVDEALPYFDQCVRLRGEAADYLWLGTTLEQLGRHEEAFSAFKSAIDLRGCATDYQFAGSLLLKKGATSEALRYLTAAAKLDDDPISRQLVQECKTKRLRQRLSVFLHAIVGVLTSIRRRFF